MCALLVFASCKKTSRSTKLKRQEQSTADFPQITADVFKPMDGGIDLSPEGNYGPQHLEPLERRQRAFLEFTSRQDSFSV